MNCLMKKDRKNPSVFKHSLNRCNRVNLAPALQISLPSRSRIMFNRNLKFSLSALGLLAFLNSCGGSSNTVTPQLPGTNLGPYPTVTVTPYPNPTYTGAYPNPYPTPTVTSSPTSGTSTLTYPFTLGGTGSTTQTYTSPSITTDTRLRVKVIGGPATNIQIETPGRYNGAYSNYSASYSCITYKVTVAGQSTTTSMIRVGENGTGLCANNPGEQVLDFSNRLQPGHGPVSITVSEPKYDYYCKLWLSGWIYGSYSNYCPLFTVYKNHRVTGSLEVEINGSSL